jgi:hypothetical protein
MDPDLRQHLEAMEQRIVGSLVQVISNMEIGTNYRLERLELIQNDLKMTLAAIRRSL